MVDHELTIEDSFSIPEEIRLPLQRFHFPRRYSAGEGLKEILKSQENSLLSPHEEYDTKPEFEKWDNDRIREKLSRISSELLSRSPAALESKPFAKKIKEVEQAYRVVMENFLYKLDKFLRSTGELRKDLIKKLQEFRMISRTSAHFTVASSVTNIALMMGSFMQNFFKYSWNPKLSLLSTVAGSISITASLIALSYMKRSANELSKDVRKEGRFLMDLITAHCKGNSIDQEVLGLFPAGINLNLIEKQILDDKRHFGDKCSWMKYLCSVIILTNIQKDIKLLHDERFLTRVKLFVESPAAEIWWNRIRMGKLMEKMRKKADNISVKKFISGHENHMHRTALHLYPALLPWLLNSWDSEGIQCICSCIAGMFAALDLGNNKTEEFEDLKKIHSSFEKDFKGIIEIFEILDNDYD